MGHSLVTPAANVLVHLDDAKLHLRVGPDDTPDDAWIVAAIQAATQYLERETGRALLAQTWDYSLDGWPAGCIYLPHSAVTAITSVTYYDTTNTPTVWGASNYLLDGSAKRVRSRLSPAYGVVWPSVTLRPMAGVVVRYTVGYTNPTDPALQILRQAALALMASWYEQREAVVVGTITKEVEMAAKAIMEMERVTGG